MQCPRCGRPASGAMKFCGECGAAMPQLTPLPAPPTEMATMPGAEQLATPRAPLRNAPAKLPPWLRVVLGLFTVAALSLVIAIVWLAWFLQTPALRRIDADTYRWGSPALRHAQAAAIYFDNGTEDALTVTIDRQGCFNVAAYTRIKLDEPAGPIVFRVTRATTANPGSAAATANATDVTIREDLREGHVYVYNPGSRFDYIVEGHMYSSLGFYGASAPDPRVITKSPYFDAGKIDFAFEPAPEGVSLPLHTVAVTKYSLAHRNP